MTENQPNCGSQNGKAKSEIVSEIARIVRKHGLDYDDWRYISKRVRQKCELLPSEERPEAAPHPDRRRFPPLLSDRGSGRRRAARPHAAACVLHGDAGLGAVPHRSVPTWTWRTARFSSTRARGRKDRYVLFGKSFATALRTHIAAHPDNRWLFQTRRNSKFTTRRVQQIVKLVCRQAGVKATPHTFRHQAITWLTRHSGMADAELQLITGHARRETLAVYQHVALDGELEGKYQEAMKKVDL